jgi:hypothetical protein
MVLPSPAATSGRRSLMLLQYCGQMNGTIVQNVMFVTTGAACDTVIPPGAKFS